MFPINKITSEIKKNTKLFDIFTRREEYHTKKLDDEGRFRYEYSSYADILKPVVSEYLVNNGFKSIYPEDKKFAVALTHDVDDIYVNTRDIFGSFTNCMIHGNLKEIPHLIKGKIDKKKSPYINFQQIIDIEEEYKARSTFFFLVKPDPDFGNNYYSKDIEPEIKKILDRNCEIGYHTRYHIFENVEKIKNEKIELERVIGKEVIGVRNHHLRFKIPNSWHVLQKSGFGYDSTLHYNDMVGFRNGMCHPFYPYDVEKNKTIDILEIPLTISDIALRSFMKINPKKAWDYIKTIIDITEKFGGVVTILWHSWTFSLPISAAGWFSKDWTKLYYKILSYCSEKDAWLTNCQDICDYEKKEGILRRV